MKREKSEWVYGCVEIWKMWKLTRCARCRSLESENWKGRKRITRTEMRKTEKKKTTGEGNTSCPQKNFSNIFDCHLKISYHIFVLLLWIFLTHLAMKSPFSFPPHPLSASALPRESRSSNHTALNKKVIFCWFCFSAGSAEADMWWGGKLKKHLLVGCPGNIHTKNYWNPIILLKVTIDNVWDVFLWHSVVVIVVVW